MESLQRIDNTQINLPIDIPTVVEIAYRSMKGELITVDDIAAAYDMTLTKAMELITNPTFSHLVHNLCIANAKLGFDAIAFKELITIARLSEDEKNKISAIRTLGDMLGFNESKKAKQSQTNINLNIDTIVRNTGQSPFKGL